MAKSLAAFLFKFYLIVLSIMSRTLNITTTLRKTSKHAKALIKCNRLLLVW